MGLDRGIHTHTHHTRELFLLPLSLSLSLSSWRSQYSPSMQSFAPLCHSLRARFWSCSRPDRSAPFTRTFPLLSPLLQPSNYITLLAFAPTGPSKGVAAKYALRSGSRGWPACIGLARPRERIQARKNSEKRRGLLLCVCVIRPGGGRHDSCEAGRDHKRKTKRPKGASCCHMTHPIQKLALEEPSRSIHPSISLQRRRPFAC
jgi:hypothetical protein